MIDESRLRSRMAILSKIFALFFVLVLTTPAWAEDAPVYHAPLTAPEKALDVILRHADEDHRLVAFVLGNDTTHKIYARFFTPTLLNLWAAQEKRSAFTYNPVTCEPRTLKDFVYFTRYAQPHFAEILVPSTVIKGKDAYNYYIIVKSGENWVLDGVDCGPGKSFNVK